MERPTARQIAWQWQERIGIADRKTLDGDQSINFNRLMDLGDPIEPYDVAHKKYVDDALLHAGGGGGEEVMIEHLATFDHPAIHPSNIVDGDPVDVTGRDIDDILAWNGTTWVPVPPSVPVVGENINDVLTWNGTTWVPVPPSVPVVGENINDVLTWNGTTWVSAPPADSGWIEVFETWTYASADAPTFTFTVVGDKSTKYYPGMRIKLTQTTVKYFIITKVAYSSPNTTITVYGGTDYTLANAAILYPYYSSAKAPAGFPLDPTKWTVLLTDSTDRHQSSPVKNTIYNPGSMSLSMPIGIWNVFFQAILVCAASSGTWADVYGGLSSSLTSFNNQTLRGRVSLGGPTAGVSIGMLSRSTVLNIATKTTYYVICMTDLDNQSVIGFNGASDASTEVRAVCAYL